MNHRPGPTSMALRAAMLIATLMTGAASARPSDDPLAWIRKIAVGQGEDASLVDGRTDRVQFRHGGAGWEPAAPDERLYGGDNVLVKPHTAAELEIRTPEGRGHFTHWVETLAAERLPAAFEIWEDPVRHGFFGLLVNYGSLVADDLHGLIVTKSRAMEAIPRGTRYLMEVDPGTGETFLFVDEGTVLAIGSVDSLHVAAGEGARALPGGAIERMALTAEVTDHFRGVIENRHTEFWRGFRPWWRNPWVIGAIGGGAAAGAVLLLTGGDEPVTGTATVIVP